MVYRRAEILPQWRAHTWVVRRKQKREHVNETESAREPDAHARHERQPDGKLSVRCEERDRCSIRQHETLQDRNHEWVRSPVLQKAVDPRLEAAA